jgi:hypothetical protein
VLHPEALFEWKELLRFNVDSDPEVMYFDDVKNTDNPTQTQNLVTESIDNGECKLVSFLRTFSGGAISSGLQLD